MPISLTAAALTLALPLARIGESDCEDLGTGALAQPINALSSFAYVVVGTIVLVITLGQSKRRVESLVYAASVAAIGLGSVAFHGPQPSGSRLLHDLPILITVLFILIHDVRLLLPRFRHPWPTFVVSAVGGAVLTAISPDAAAVATGLVIGGVAVAETLIYRRRLRPLDDRRQRLAYLLIIGVAAVAATTWLLGRIDSPACDPDGVVQFHGVWHVLSSPVFGLWWWLALGSEAAPARVDTNPDRSEQAV